MTKKVFLKDRRLVHGANLGKTAERLSKFRQKNAQDLSPYEQAKIQGCSIEQLRDIARWLGRGNS